MTAWTAVQREWLRGAHGSPGIQVTSGYRYRVSSKDACGSMISRRVAPSSVLCQRGGKKSVDTSMSKRPAKRLTRGTGTITKASGAGEVNALGDINHPSSSSSSSANVNWSVARLTSPWDAEIFNLAIPALFSTLLDPIMGVVDTAIVGRLGTEPLAAVGLATIVYNFSNFIWNFLLYTTTPRIAAAASRNDTAQVSAITAQGLWVAACIGCTMTILLWNYCPMILHGMGASPGVLHHAVQYLRGRCIASPAIMMFYVLSGTFRGFKDTRYVFIFLSRLCLSVCCVFSCARLCKFYRRTLLFCCTGPPCWLGSLVTLSTWDLTLLWYLDWDGEYLAPR